MHQRTITLGLLWLAMAALLVLVGLLWSLRGAGGGAVDAALAISVLLLPLPPLCAFVLRRHVDDSQAHKAATEAKTRFLAQISHEIRTPMNAVMGMTQLALQTRLTAEQRDLLTKADAASRMLLSLINDVLDVSKIEAGHMEIESLPLRLEDVVGQAIELVRPVHVNAEVALVCDWADASLLGARGQLRGDALRLQQVLVNLLSNALKFTPTGQVLLRLSAHPSDSEGRVPLSITVQDSGIGMSAQQLDGLFQEFRQGDASIQRRYGGTGLGLAITRRLVELMGGSLDVQSQPERGSSFEIRLTLPLDPDAALPAPPQAQRLLLAEAHADHREATLAVLRHLGLGPGLAASVDVATTLALLAEARQANQPFDWLLLDWRLPGPGATGAELLAQLRRDQPALRIAVLSPPGPDEEPAQARAFGARALCPKPLLAGELRRLLSDVPGDRPATVDAQSLAGLRVLLVEDHPINQEIALRLLGSRGAQIDVAGNGQEGLDRLQARGPDAYDLVLMDLQMPVLDGLSATRRLRELPGFENLPVLAMTAHALAEERAACVAAGMQGHIAKPLDVARLVRELQRYRPQAPPRRHRRARRWTCRSACASSTGRRRCTAARCRVLPTNTRPGSVPGPAGWPAANGPSCAAPRTPCKAWPRRWAPGRCTPLALALERSAAAADAVNAGPQLSRVEAGLVELQARSRSPCPAPGEAAAPRAHGRATWPNCASCWPRATAARWTGGRRTAPTAGWDAELQRRLDRALAALDFDAAAQALDPAPKGGA